MSDARSVIMARIRSALAAAPPEPVPVPRDYHRQTLSGTGDIDRFVQTVGDYRARVRRVDPVGIAAAVADLLPADARVVVPADLPGDWIAGPAAVRDDPALSVAELDGVEAVVTGCAVGIAATGTIVLDGGAAQGRRALTLVPDHHICIVFTDQIVDTLPQALAALDPGRPLTFISGPSATSDIELDRVEGVHGPRTLDVLISPRR
jgi:L-lactate dehydrogenase complex protein LldG